MRIELPSVKQITVEQFTDLINAKNIFGEVAALTGYTEQEVASYKSGAFDDYFYDQYKRLNEELIIFNKKTRATSIEIGGVKVLIPKDITQLSLGAIIGASNAMFEAQKKGSDNYAIEDVLANLLYEANCKANGQTYALYDEDFVNDYSYRRLIRQLPIIEALPLAHCFFLTLRNYWNVGEKPSFLNRTMLKFVRVAKRWKGTGG